MTHRLEGVWPALTVPFDDRGELLLDIFAENCKWQVESGSDGVVVNGSLGEYEVLTHEERMAIVETAIAAVGAERVIPGVSDKSGDLALAWARQAKKLGVEAVMALPPTSHAPTDDEAAAHFARIAEAGLPIIAYNNPFSTRIDLTPSLLGRIAKEVPLVFAVKDFSQDVRRVLQTMEQAPSLQLIVGCDDVMFEAVGVGARGWIAGFANAFPDQSAHLYSMAVKGDSERVLPLYREMLPILRWDADPRFVQAIKIGQEIAGRYGGPVRLPRIALPKADADLVRRDALRAIKAGMG